jgi:hypothetical protein
MFRTVMDESRDPASFVLHPLTSIMKKSLTLVRIATKKPARRPVEVEIKRAENKKHYQKANW